MARPVLDQINMVVNDMDAMAEFYGHLGLALDRSTPEWAPHHRNTEVEGGLHLDLDSPQFASVWNQGWPAGRSGAVLGFRVESRDDVDATYEDLTSYGYKGQQPPYDAFWGARYAVVSDPDGNAVGLMSESDPSLVKAPPAPPT